MNVKRKVVLATGLLAGMCAFPANIYFEAADGAASEPSNWSTGSVPGASDAAMMTNATSAVMRISDGDNLVFASLKAGAGTGAGNTQTIIHTGGSLLASGSDASLMAEGHEYDTVYYLLSGNGTVEFAGGGDGVHIGGRGSCAFNMDGGTLRLSKGYPRLAGWQGWGVLDVRGGNVEVTSGANTFGVGVKSGGTGVLNVGGTGTFSSVKPVSICLDASNSSGFVNVLPGGTLAIPQIKNNKGGTDYFNLAGGTVAPTGISYVAASFVTNLPMVVNAGGARFDTDGKDLSLRSSLTTGRLCKQGLHRRWSFANGSLRDSIGNVTGSKKGTVALDDGSVTLPGGAHDSACVTLQSGGEILPADYTDGVTLEFWVTPNDYVHYARVFRLHNGSDYLYLSFNKGTSNASGLNYGQLHYGNTNYSSDNPTAAWTLGQRTHFAVVLRKNQSDGTWTCTFYRHDARNGLLYRSKATSSTIPSTFDPTAFNVAGADFSLGLSDDGNNDAAATYHEVRIWKHALTKAELCASAAMGPDANLESGVGLLKSGAGTLVLSGANAYAGATTVSAGTLALGAEGLRPCHRWSFNNSLNDSEGGYASLVARTAEKLGSNSGQISFTADGKAISLPGGNNKTAYLRLVPAYGNTFPTNATSVTLELWARQDAARSWSRIFNFANNTGWQQFMTWTVNEDVNSEQVRVSYNTTAATATAKMAPYTIGTMYHISMVAEKDASDAWQVTFRKHDAATGELLKSHTLVPPANWDLNAFKVGDLTLGMSVSGDKDAQATYDEVRAWGRALTGQELATNAKLGPDTLPVLPATASEPATLPSGTDLTIAQGGRLSLAGATQTVASLSGGGMVAGTGTLTATGGIHPSGTLTVAGGAKLVGTVTIDCLANGECDKIAFMRGGTYDVSGLTLTAGECSGMSSGVDYTVFDATGATLQGAPDVSALSMRFAVTVQNGTVTLRKQPGMTVIIR